MKARLDAGRLDRLARLLFQPGMSELPELEPDSMFLARLRRRLDLADLERSREGESLGTLSWKLSPLVAALCLLMLISFWWTAATRGWQPDPVEVLLWESTTSAESLPDRNLILDAVLNYRQEGD